MAEDKSTSNGSTQKRIEKGLRQFGLTSLAVDNATSVFLLTAMIFIFGVMSYERMPKESFPEVPWPKVYINTVYFGNSASDIENLVTRPIEKQLQSVNEIKTITSSSLQDYSLIVAEFEADVDLDEAVRKVKDAVDKAKPDLPDDLTQEPEVLDINLSEIPIMSVNVAGDLPPEELVHYAEYLQDKIEELPEISEVVMKGNRDKEVRIDVDLHKMQSLKVSFRDIANAIQQENLNMSGGEVVAHGYRRTVRVVGEFQDIREIENLVVKSERQRPIFLKEIAEVSFDYAERKSIARVNRLPVISLDVIKRSGENLLSAADKIKQIIAQAQAEILPPEVEVTVFNDQSIRTRKMVSNLENSIISGMILVVLVLLFFLGIRNALFVGLAIPLSMLMGIMLTNLLGYTLNMVILFSLILALGMLVDNAIVVVENVYRYCQLGYSGWAAAKYGTGEVAVPIITSTATTLMAFLPMAFWPGLMGSFMKYLPITLIVVLTSSLFVALVINPVFTSKLMKVDEPAKELTTRQRRRRNVLIAVGAMGLASLGFHALGVLWMRHVLWIVMAVTLLNFFVLRPLTFGFQRFVLPALERAYDWFIRFALRKYNPVFFFFSTVGLLVVALVLLAATPPKVTLFANPDPLYVNAFIELPIGTDIEATNERVKEVESRIMQTIRPYRDVVESVLTQIGKNTSDPNAGPDFSASPHKARITVAFVPDDQRHGISTSEIMEAIRANLRGMPGVEIVVDKNQVGPPTGKPINIELKGEDIETLARLSDDLVKFIERKHIPGIEELKTDLVLGKPELVVHIDRGAARRYQISTYQIADAIRTAIFGKEVSQFKLGEEEYPIQLRLSEAYRHNIDDILNQKITFRNPANGRIVQVPISAVVSFEYSTTFNSINRKDQERVVTIYSNVLKGYNANEIVQELDSYLKRYPFPEGYGYEFTGEQQRQAEEMEFLSMALAIALFGILIILVAQFNSISAPVIIMFSVLFSTIGVFLGYILSGMDVQIVMTGVGIISLAGIVVNNAIVLIDYTNLTIRRRLKAAGLDRPEQLPFRKIKEAIVEGGATRLRPVLLTAITTVLGLVPLAYGINFNFFTFVSQLDPQFFMGGDSAAFWGTMAWTVIYGLTFSTFLTLVVVPVMYWLAYRLKVGLKRRLGLIDADSVQKASHQLEEIPY